MTYSKSLLATLLAFVILLGSCATSRQSTNDGSLSTANGTGVRKTGMSKTAKGGIIGAGGGAVVGGVIGGLIGGGRGTAAGAILGAAVGGTGGALIGRRMDKQAQELQRDMANAQIERVGEGIKITFNSGILFATNSATLNPTSQADITTLAATLKKYADTNVVVEGHTDNTGSDAINQPLSQNRAQSVAAQLEAQGVEASRITTKGYGSTQPVGDNATDAGRTLNRRVEVAIFANEKMRKAAEKGTL